MSSPFLHECLTNINIHFYTVINWNFYYSTPKLWRTNPQGTHRKKYHIQHLQRGKCWEKAPSSWRTECWKRIECEHIKSFEVQLEHLSMQFPTEHCPNSLKPSRTFTFLSLCTLAISGNASLVWPIRPCVSSEMEK